MTDFERTIEFAPAWDKRNSNALHDYGIHGVEMRWLLKGPLGVVQFVVYTNWHLPHIEAADAARAHTFDAVAYRIRRPMPADLGYHSPRPMYDGQEPRDDCPFLKGDCYYDGSTLNADPVFDLLVEKGHEAVWARLEDYYNERFVTEASHA